MFIWFLLHFNQVPSYFRDGLKYIEIPYCRSQSIQTMELSVKTEVLSQSFYNNSLGSMLKMLVEQFITEIYSRYA